MDNVVSLKDFRAEKEPHLSGRAKCLDCDKAWEAVAPLGVHQLECPDCKTMRGRWNHPIGSAPGSRVFACYDCRNTAWEIRDDQTMLCICCGKVATTP